jgi:epoxyqueuosine reductase
MRVSSDSSSVETLPQQQNFSVSLKQQALALGFDKVGIVRAGSLSEEARHLDEWLDLGYHADMAWMQRDSEKRVDTRRLFRQRDR